MNELSNTLIAISHGFQKTMHYSLMALGVLWGVHLVNALSGYKLNRLGLIPRNVMGIPGIFFAPFLHGDFNHLFFNSIPFFVLSNFILLQGTEVYLMVTFWVILLGGGLIWLLGRQGIHIGASSLIMGYWSYLLIDAYEQGTTLAIILGFIVLYYFGSMFFSILPSKESTSFEGHFFGMLGGIGTYFLLPHLF